MINVIILNVIAKKSRLLPHINIYSKMAPKKLEKVFRGTQTALNKFFNPAINATAQFLGMAVSAKNKVQRSDKQRLIF